MIKIRIRRLEKCSYTHKSFKTCLCCKALVKFGSMPVFVTDIAPICLDATGAGEQDVAEYETNLAVVASFGGDVKILNGINIFAEDPKPSGVTKVDIAMVVGLWPYVPGDVGLTDSQYSEYGASGSTGITTAAMNHLRGKLPDALLICMVPKAYMMEVAALSNPCWVGRIAHEGFPGMDWIGRFGEDGSAHFYNVEDRVAYVSCPAGVSGLLELYTTDGALRVLALLSKAYLRGLTVVQYAANRMAFSRDMMIAITLAVKDELKKEKAIGNNGKKKIAKKVKKKNSRQKKK